MYRNEFNFTVAKEGNAKLIDRMNAMRQEVEIDWTIALATKELIDNEIQIAEAA